MASAKELFDEEMLKIMTCVFRTFYTSDLCDDPLIIAIRDKMSTKNSHYDMKSIVDVDIIEDEFWDITFKTMIILLFYHIIYQLLI